MSMCSARVLRLKAQALLREEKNDAVSNTTWLERRYDVVARTCGSVVIHSTDQIPLATICEDGLWRRAYVHLR